MVLRLTQPFTLAFLKVATSLQRLWVGKISSYRAAHCAKRFCVAYGSIEAGSLHAAALCSICGAANYPSKRSALWGGNRWQNNPSFSQGLPLLNTYGGMSEGSHGKDVDLSPMASSLRLALVGDVMLGRLVDQLFPTHVDAPEDQDHCRTLLHRYERHQQAQQLRHRYVWGDVAPLFEKHRADLRIGNLETSVTHHPEKWPNKAFNYRMAPENLQALKDANFDFVSLANNHVLDFCEQGLADTLAGLDEWNIAHAGAGMNLEKAMAPAVLKVQDLTVGCFSFSDHYEFWAAGDNTAGINYVNPETINDTDRARIKDAIGRHRQREGLEVIIVCIHWGSNYCWQPPKSFQRFAHFLMDECSVDIIHGHSSHHVQGIEIYKGRPILYGCGDFVDDYAVDPEYRNDLSFVYLVDYDPTARAARRLELVPTLCAAMQVHCLPLNSRGQKWLQLTMTRLCADLGTKVQPMPNGHLLIEV